MEVVQERASKNANHDYVCAYRKYFSDRLSEVCTVLDARAESIADQRKSVAQLNFALNQAVKIGKPPEFIDDDANIIYSRDRFPTRVRYMYTSLMSDLLVSNFVRSLLLPSLKGPKVVKIASIGSGPGEERVKCGFGFKCEA